MTFTLVRAPDPRLRPDRIYLDVVGTITSEKADGIVAALAASPNASEIQLVANSSGGEYWAAHTAFVHLCRHPAKKKTAFIDRAESAALLPALACDVRMARPSSAVLLHQPVVPLNGAYGAAELRELADALDWLSGEMADVIAERTGADPAEILEEMKTEAETSIARACELGIVTEIWNDRRA